MESAVSPTGADRTEDTVLGFTIPARSGRGRLLRLGDALNVILSAHDYPPRIAALLAEALVLTGLIGSALKGDEGQTTLQARGQGGPVNLLVCDYRAGELRGHVGFDREAEIAEDAGLGALFGEGYLAVTIDRAHGKERYQGIVPMQGASLAAAAETYFDSSEQIPTLIRTNVEWTDEGWAAGGILLQLLGRQEEGGDRLHVRQDRENWEHLEILGDTTRPDELTNGDLPLENLLWRLFNEDEVRIIPAVPLSRGCRCSVQMIEERLATLPDAEKNEIRGPEGTVSVDCEFCSKQFEVRV